jgi:hypothetical protein
MNRSIAHILNGTLDRKTNREACIDGSQSSRPFVLTPRMQCLMSPDLIDDTRLVGSMQQHHVVSPRKVGIVTRWQRTTRAATS